MGIISIVMNRAKAGFPLIRRAGAALLSPGGTTPGPTPDDPPVEVPKGWLRSKTIVATIAGFAYTLGITLGLWDIPQEDFLAIAIPLLTAAGAIYGRLAAKSPVSGSR